MDVPQGPHTIRLSNTGKDWIGIKDLRLTNYRSDLMVNARIAGLVLDDEMLAWIQNRDYTIKALEAGGTPDPVKDTSFTIEGADDGDYTVESWHTFVLSLNEERPEALP